MNKFILIVRYDLESVFLMIELSLICNYMMVKDDLFCIIIKLFV